MLGQQLQSGLQDRLVGFGVAGATSALLARTCVRFYRRWLMRGPSPWDPLLISPWEGEGDGSRARGRLLVAGGVGVLN